MPGDRGFRSRRQRRLDVETIAQSAALEELGVFYKLILNSRITAERAAIFLGGNCQSRFEGVLRAVEHAMAFLPDVALSETAVARRATGRAAKPEFQLKPAPQPDARTGVSSAEELAIPLEEAMRMRENGASWRFIRESMLDRVNGAA